VQVHPFAVNISTIIGQVCYAKALRNYEQYLLVKLDVIPITNFLRTLKLSVLKPICDYVATQIGLSQHYLETYY
jgi:hypothetical protein